MATDEELKKAEHNGYSKGYQAGRRRRRVEIDAERTRLAVLFANEALKQRKVF